MKYKIDFEIVLFIMFLISYMLFMIVIFTRNNYDVNNDGKVNAQDYTEIKNYIMNKEN